MIVIDDDMSLLVDNLPDSEDHNDDILHVTPLHHKQDRLQRECEI